MHGNQREALAYIAGIMDGEGSIMIRRDCSVLYMKLNKRKNPHYHPHIRVGMLDREPLDFIVRTMGFGKVYEEKPYHHKRPMFRYCLGRKTEVVSFINQIKEFLLIKNKQADLALEFMEKCVKGTNVPITVEIHELRKEMWMKMRTLNGVVEVPATTERRNKGGRAKGIRLEATV